MLVFTLGTSCIVAVFSTLSTLVSSTAPAVVVAPDS
jgi:hypothetical protein